MTAVSDNFNRADSSSLGASWTEVVGDWAIVSNKVQCNDDDGGTGYYLRYETDVGSSDMFAQGVTTSTQADSGSNTGLAVRMRAAANTSYQMTTRHAGDTIGVWRIVAGAESQQNWQTEAQAISVTINSGDTIRVEAVGSLIRGKVSGALAGICVDTNITDGQRAGLNGYNNVGTDVVELDDFAGGALAADGGLVAPYIVGISTQVTGTGTTLTPTVPANLASGDLVVAHCTSRDAAQTMTNPGSEGWAAGPTPTQTGLEDAIFYKVWGLGGQTDDTTPTFSIGSGTAGWGVTLTVFRNPSHATAPWTSTSAAVVASGSAANASSATVTAPSVNHDGTNRTVVRLFSSADDNALNTPNVGALAYGAAAYDSTTGNDFSQAMSLRENITVTTNTSTATVTETVLGNDINNGITLVLAIPNSATNVNAGNAAGTGEAGGVDASIAVNAGGPTGAGTVPAASARLAPNAGLSSGTGAAFGGAPSVAPSAGAATGSGSAPGASMFVAAFAAVASGSGEASGATVSTAVATEASAGVAEGSGAAGTVSPALTVPAGAAEGTGNTPQAAPTVAPTAGPGLGTGDAGQATAATGSFTNADAGSAVGSGTAGQVSTSMATNAGVTAGTGSAGQASGGVGAAAGAAAGSGSALAPSARIEQYAIAGLAAGAGAALGSSVSIGAHAGSAAGEGAAWPATTVAPPAPLIVGLLDSDPGPWATGSVGGSTGSTAAGSVEDQDHPGAILDDTPDHTAVGTLG